MLGVAAAEQDQGDGEGGGGVAGEDGQAGPGGQGRGVWPVVKMACPALPGRNLTTVSWIEAGSGQQQPGQDEDQSDQGGDGAGAAADDGARATAKTPRRPR